MDLVKRQAIPEIRRLECDKHDPPCANFNIEFRESFSTQEYNTHRRTAGMKVGEPDELHVICTQCGNEIAILDTSEGKVPMPNFKAQDKFRRNLDDLTDASRYAADTFRRYYDEEGWKEHW